MFLFKTRPAEPGLALLEELTGELAPKRWYVFKTKESGAGRKILEATAEEQRAFVLAALRWMSKQNWQSFNPAPWKVRTTMLTVLRRRLPLTHEDILALLDWSRSGQNNYWRGVPQMIKIVEDYLKQNAPTEALHERVGLLAESVDGQYVDAEARKWLARLRELAGLASLSLPLVAGEPWAEEAAADVAASPEPARSAWLDLLNACTQAAGPAPTAKWLKAARAALEKIGADEFRRAALKWFALVDRPGTHPPAPRREWHPDPNQLIAPVNADVLRGLVWLCADAEGGDVARALAALAVSAYRKVTHVGPRCVRVGNACVWALGRMPGAEGLGQLALLKVRVKFGTAQKVIESALAEAARRAGLPQDEVEEMAVPAYGLQEVGLRRERLGDYAAELAVTGTSSAELRWFRPDGKRQTSVPQAVREQHAEDLKELQQAVKDVRKMLAAQAERIDNLYLEQKSWPLGAWRERYLEHPLVGTIARRLIWRFTKGGQVGSGIWREGRMVASDGRGLDWLDDETRVELWHPIHETTEAVLAWRDRLAELEVRQPFKQAHREVYLLTVAEERTRVYSNRFAAHIIRQHQFNALCAARGWKNKLRLMVDDDFPPAMRMLPKLDLRAEFWVEAIGENYGADTNDAGTYLYLTTDQVRFYRMDAPQHYGHAGGGGYYTRPYGQAAPREPLPLEEIPPLVLSEVMRDVDMFVGVASVANDPHWADGGPEGRYRDYWTSYSFGELSETAKTRRQVLERLVPRLKIADRCRLNDKYLVVRGDIRTYKIHLGSGNILMEPNDQYLCIVAARGPAPAGDSAAGKVYLPFEGDNTLAIILSKAFLLAEDWKITDPTILRQLGR